MGSSKRPRRPHQIKSISRARVARNSNEENEAVTVEKPLKGMENFVSLENFLTGEGILEEVTARAIKRVIALQLKQAMIERRLSKVAVADRMGTSRRQLDRVLDDKAHDAISIETLARAANAVGKKLKVELV
jgi:antitoxin HicB